MKPSEQAATEDISDQAVAPDPTPRIHHTPFTTRDVQKEASTRDETLSFATREPWLDDVDHADVHTQHLDCVQKGYHSGVWGSGVS